MPKTRRILKAAGDMNHHLEGIFSKIISVFLMRNFGGQKTVGQYNQSAKRQNLSTNNCLSSKLSLKSEGEIKTFPD